MKDRHTSSEKSALIQALAILKPAADDVTAVLASVLGFDLLASTAVSQGSTSPVLDAALSGPLEATSLKPLEATSPEPLEATSPEPLEVTDSESHLSPGLASSAALPEEGVVIPTVLERRSPARLAPTAMHVNLGSKSVAEEISPMEDPDKISALSLLRENWQRSILYSLLSMPTESTEVDVDILVDIIARISEVEHFPRVKRQTLRRGGDILIDVSYSMQPFSHDSVALVRTLRKLVNTDIFRILFFDSIPYRVGFGSKLSWNSYIPQRSKPVLIVTDFGYNAPFLSPGITIEDWLDFYSFLHAFQCSVSVLTPRRIDALPDRLRSFFPILEWDRTTTPGSVRWHLEDYQKSGHNE